MLIKLNNTFSSRNIKISRLIIIFMLLSLCGCSPVANSPESVSGTNSNAGVTVIDPNITDLTSLTDGILHCLSTKNYQWLQYYADTELTGLQIARLILGDSAFDRNIVGWNTKKITIKFNSEHTIAVVSIPVSHEARVDKKFNARETIFNFQFYYSENQMRWLLNFNFLNKQPDN